MSNKKGTMSRRRLLQGFGAAGLLGAAGAGLSTLWRPSQNIWANPNIPKDPKFLVVLSCGGGASLIDSFLAIRESESKESDTINCFPDQLVKDIPNSPFRAVDQKVDAIGPIPMPLRANQSNFVKKHKDDMMVITQTGTSVTHQIAQRRSVTGNEAWLGRTLQECVAMTHGENFTLPNVLLATGTSFIERGTDDSLPLYAYGETVANPAVWPLGLDGTKGVTKIDPKLIHEMRTLRNEKLDPQTRFAKVFSKNQMLRRWNALRGSSQRKIENQNLITKLMMFPDSAKYPLKASGLEASPAARLVRDKFPNMEIDPLEAQAALAFLLFKFGVSVTTTIGPRFDVVAHGEGNILRRAQGSLPEGTVINPPIAFDFSHQGHRSTQAMMWQRVLKAADSLIDLLKSEEYAKGESYWDRTMIYLATDFGRSKNRPSGSSSFGTSHDLNNGYLVISPLVKGNTVLGGVNPDTGLTYGWNIKTGAPEKHRNAEEKEVFAGLLQALGVDTSKSDLPDVPAIRKKA